ncbi:MULTISPECIES: hypothetical protein [Saliphagus]|uniref:Archaeal Type IV pilin N-terminal domain-containing protein n=1 Tax=Saliphagus infecundisoli TaxID=1849069 RepID=A0ABD5QF45_9EURY|nr:MULTISPECIES: hypothetical protein [Saliphagus]
MIRTRRELLHTGSLIGCVCLSGCQTFSSCSAEVACFEFEHEGYDDAPDVLTITHTGGDSLPANEVFITNVAVDYNDEEIATVPWYELSANVDADDEIEGDSITVEILFPEVVEVLWRQDGEERVIGETRDFR